MYQRKDLGSFSRHYHFHFVGIGGIGMSGLAYVLLQSGHKVSGSDLNQNVQTRRLSAVGVTIFQGHDASHVKNADFLVISSAVSAENPERMAAAKLNIPVLPRGRLMGQLMRLQYGISIAGTHGKTTTTSLVTHMFCHAGKDPSYLIGGCLPGQQSNAGVGKSPYLICEVDESDGSFIEAESFVAVVTNIDADHLESFDNCFENLQSAFLQYLEQLPFNGVAILGVDDPQVRRLAEQYSGNTIQYSIGTDADVVAYDIRQDGLKSYFEVRHRDCEHPFSVMIPLPGMHNVQNALAAICVGIHEQLTISEIQKGLSSFQGVSRRCDVLSNTLFDKPVTVIDDYGHHPCEMTATLQAIEAAWPDRRLIWIFQPHRFSRTAAHFQAYIECLSCVKGLILLEVYSAGEMPLEGAQSVDIADAIEQKTQRRPLVLEGKPDFESMLHEVVQQNDIVLFQGAGSISSWAREFVECQLQTA